MTQEKMTIGALLATELDNGSFGEPTETADVAVDYSDATNEEVLAIIDKFGG